MVMFNILAIVHVGAVLSCIASVQKKGSVGLSASDLPVFPCCFVMQVKLSFLQRLCSEAVILQTDGELAIRVLAEEPSKLRQKPKPTRTTHSFQSMVVSDPRLGI